MNNLLDFIEYKRRVRLYEESLVKSQILEPILEEGLRSKIRKKINDKAGVFVRQALADEIEMGEKLNEEITAAIDELKEYVNKIQQEVNNSHPQHGTFFNKMQKIFQDIDKATFSLLTLLGGVEINFADFVDNAIMANMVNFGVLFIPTRNVFLLRKSYKYFIGIVKNTIRRDLLMLWINFDQFENTVLIESLDEEEQRKWEEQYQTQLSVVYDIQKKIIGEGELKGIVKKGKTQDDLKKMLDNYKKSLDLQGKMQDRMNSAGFRADAYGNTYTRTLEQLKNFVLEDDQKYLEAIKRSMLELAIDEIDTKSYVNLLIDAAEECAYEVSNAIHNNFLSMVSVFKLSNQKRLVELVRKDHDIFEEKRKKLEQEEKERLDFEEMEKRKEVYNTKGEEILNKILNGDSKSDSIGKKQLENYKNLGETEEIDGKKYKEVDVFLGWLQLDNNKNWNDNKDKLKKLLKLHLYQLDSLDEDDSINEDSFYKYIPIICDLEKFVWKEKSKGGIKSTTKTKKTTKTTTSETESTTYDTSKEEEIKGFSLNDDAEDLKDKKERILKLLCRKPISDKKISRNKEKILEEVFDLIRIHVFTNNRDFRDNGMGNFLKIIKTLCEKDKIEWEDVSTVKNDIEKMKKFYYQEIEETKKGED